MLKDVIEVMPLDNYLLALRFEDGTKGTVDISKLTDFIGVFAPLLDPTYFNQVYVNSELGTICWPNQADIDPDVLYSLVTGEPLPTFERILI
ncbi:MAG: DUF2442 domain-containing protein [Chloroflexi bacterium]|nr:DUF2442 domain-containing protein [Chloroflexota bacterium]